jgi:uncharacterized protein (TIGR00251 family)
MAFDRWAGSVLAHVSPKMQPYSMEGQRMLLSVKVRPNSTHTCISVIEKERVVVNLRPPPEGNKANRELIRLIRKVFSVDTSCVRIISGATSSKKLLAVVIEDTSKDIEGALEESLLRPL